MQLVELDISRNGKVRARGPSSSRRGGAVLRPGREQAEPSRGAADPLVVLSWETWLCFCVLGCHQYRCPAFLDRLFSRFFFSFTYFFSRHSRDS